jgi:hypothetical protein
MKNTTLPTIVSLALACAGLGMAPLSRAAHYTNYLDALQAEVEARLETTDDAGQRKALTAADKALNHNTKTLGQDLKTLGTAAAALNRGFTDDAGLNDLENGALNSFFGEAESQLDSVHSGTELINGDLPRSLSNALAKADAALSNAETNEDFATRVRALNVAFTKIHVAQLQLAHAVKAPESLDGRDVSVVAKPAGEKPNHFTLNADGTYDTGDETGTWTYTRTSANTGTITMNVDGGGTHVADVTFKSSKSGTFVAEGEDVTGSIHVK